MIGIRDLLIQKLLEERFSSIMKESIDYCEFNLKSSVYRFLDEYSLFLQRFFGVFPETFNKQRVVYSSSIRKLETIYFIHFEKTVTFELVVQSGIAQYCLVDFDIAVLTEVVEKTIRDLEEEERQEA